MMNPNVKTALLAMSYIIGVSLGAILDYYGILGGWYIFMIFFVAVFSLIIGMLIMKLNIVDKIRIGKEIIK